MQQPVDDVPTPLDELATGLQQLRVDAGSPSYAEIVARISRQRVARGVPAEESRPARTTVYDAFRTGRRRIDTDLVVEIVRALGVDPEETARWATRCRRARAAVALSAPPEPAPPPAPAPPVPPASPESHEIPESPGTLDPAVPEDGRRWSRPRRRALLVVVAVLACIGLNLLGRVLVDLLGLPLYLDMNGTAIAALALGPWWGVLVGVLTNAGGAAVSGPVSLAFIPVNVVGALLWGYGVRRLGAGATIPRYFLLNVVVALGCSAVAVPTIVLVLGGLTGNGADGISATATVVSGGHAVVSVAVVNVLTSLADKMIAGFVGLAVLESLPRGGRTRRPGPFLAPRADRGISTAR